MVAVRLASKSRIDFKWVGVSSRLHFALATLSS
jgi:hypothetical protein